MTNFSFSESSGRESGLQRCDRKLSPKGGLAQPPSRASLIPKAQPGWGRYLSPLGIRPLGVHTHSHRESMMSSRVPTGLTREGSEGRDFARTPQHPIRGLGLGSCINWLHFLGGEGFLAGYCSPGYRSFSIPGVGGGQ